jgi:hypothetical protein
LYIILTDIELLMKLVRLTKMLLTKPNMKSLYVYICLIVFLSKNSLKQGDALSPPLFNFALEYAIRKVLENQIA